MSWKMIARDLLVACVTAIAWWIETTAVPAGGVLFWAATLVAGVATALVGFFLHEWGHLAGSLLSGSVVHYPNRIWAPLLFHFDGEHNDRRQFLWMSYGGYLASAVGLGVIVALAPTDRWSGRIALSLVALGVLVTFVAEVPTTIKVLRGAPLPRGFAFRPPRATGAGAALSSE